MTSRSFAGAKARGLVWDAIPGLHFKGFLLRERGRLGAIAIEYSSLYLWQQDEAFRAAMLAGRYETVTDSFGRAAIETPLRSMRARGQGAKPASVQGTTGHSVRCRPDARVRGRD